MTKPTPGRRQRRFGQNFLADPNLLDLIVRESAAGPGDVVLEVGGGAGALTERLVASGLERLHVVELDERLRDGLESLAARHPQISLLMGDAMRVSLADLRPAPNRLISNLPYSIATPLLLRSITELPSLQSWLAMVQLEAGQRLRAKPGTSEYGSPSVIAQLACEVELVRRVDPAVFTPRPRVGSALIRMTRRRVAPSPELSRLVRDAFAHRRKSLARSLEHARPGALRPARAALEGLGLPADARAESLSPAQFEALGNALIETGGR